MGKVGSQLLKEFWFPLVVAFGWTFYNLAFQPKQPWTIADLINLFAPTFFLVSWLLSQLFRVRKQQRVEDGLVGIEAKVSNMLSELDRKTSDLGAAITGGDSFCYLLVTGDSAGQVQSAVVHQGRHPLYGVTIRIVDLEQFDRIAADAADAKRPLSLTEIQQAEAHVSIGDLIPQHAYPVTLTTQLGTGPDRRFNVFFQARNGAFTQLLRLHLLRGGWVSATQVNRDGQTVFEEIDPTYPRDEAGRVHWN